MARIELTPSEIFFSQDSIKNRFGDDTRHSHKLIGETLDDILSGKCSIRDIPTISVVKRSGIWVTADNRRLWVFKKLHKLGKCDKITVMVINYLNPKKNCIQSTTRVRQRGNLGGYLWKSLENQINAGISPVRQNQNEVFGLSTQRNALLDSSTRNLSEVQSFCESETSSNKSFSHENIPDSYYGCKIETRGTGYSDETFSVPVDSAVLTHSENSNPCYKVSRGTSSCFGSRTQSYQGTVEQSMLSDSSEYSTQWDTCSYTSENVEISKLTISDRNPCLQEGNSLTAIEASIDDIHGPKHYSVQSTLVPEKEQSPVVGNYETVVNLNPMDVGFAGTSFLSFDGEKFGEWLDELSECFPKLSMNMSMNVYKYQGKYYSEEVLELLASQILHRLTGNVRICGTLIPRPMNVSIYRLHDSVMSYDRIRGQKWKSFITLNSLPTKKRLSISLSDIFYTRSSINGTYRGRSIAKGLVELFTSGTRSHELNVMEYDSKYYALENKKLWILKHAEKVLEKFTIMGNIKISMDYIMFQSFTVKDVKTMDVQWSRFMHTDEEKFILEYIHRCNSSSYVNRRTNICPGIRTQPYQGTLKSLPMDKSVCSTKRNSYTSENEEISSQLVSQRTPRPQEGNSLTATETFKNETYDSKKCRTQSNLVQEKEQCPDTSNYERVVNLNPMDVGFVGKSFVSFHGEKFGEWLDKLSERFPKLSTNMPLFVFKHQEKYYSEEVLELLASQILHRLTGNVRICGTLIPRPMNVSIYRLHDFVMSYDRIRGQKWKSFITLNSLPTKKRLSISLSDIFYTRSSINGTYRGRSIAKGLVELFTSGARSHELNVMEYENKYYALENKKLWILKYAEKVLGKLTITGNVKISMDDVMFCSFTVKDIKTVDVQLSRDVYTEEEKFILKSIHKMEIPLS